MELKTRFKVIMSSEADAFLDTLRQDVKDKIIYNVDKVANGYMDKDLFNLKSASNLNGNLNCSKELEHYAS